MGAREHGEARRPGRPLRRSTADGLDFRPWRATASDWPRRSRRRHEVVETVRLDHAAVHASGLDENRRSTGILSTVTAHRSAVTGARELRTPARWRSSLSFTSEIRRAWDPTSKKPSVRSRLMDGAIEPGRRSVNTGQPVAAPFIGRHSLSVNDDRGWRTFVNGERRPSGAPFVGTTARWIGRSRGTTDAPSQGRRPVHVLPHPGTSRSRDDKNLDAIVRSRSRDRPDRGRMWIQQQQRHRGAGHRRRLFRSPPRPPFPSRTPRARRSSGRRCPTPPEASPSTRRG